MVVFGTKPIDRFGAVPRRQLLPAHLNVSFSYHWIAADASARVALLRGKPSSSLTSATKSCCEGSNWSEQKPFIAYGLRRSAANPPSPSFKFLLRSTT